tara:strand:+ start:520 stop:1092 length:573 start_codon:yes stop_codon:yes gene_type:complete
MNKCNAGNIFNNSDYNSSDGMLTSVWGPSLWHSLHIISFNYPVHPTKEQKKQYFDFFISLKDILPCKYCRINYKKNIKSVKLNMAVMKNRNTLSKWLYKLHEEINTMLGKKSNLTYDDVRERYEMFRARCITEKGKTKKRQVKVKPKREKGCVKPLYGVKSKCVISIVPKKTKCKTFKVDKKCVLKRNSQ